MLNLIVAVDENWGIGKDNDLLYHIPEDMAMFKKKTLNNVVIYGKNTLFSFPNREPLKDRINVVLSHNYHISNNVLVMDNIDELFKLLSSFSDRELFVCGGESVYKQLYQYCDYAYVTKIQKHDIEATRFCPNLDEDKSWVIAKESDIFISKNGIPYKFVEYKKQ